MKHLRLSVATAALALCLAPAALFAAEDTAKDKAPADPQETYRMLKIFGEVFERVRAQYVDQKTDKELIEYAIGGMLSSLDPHSSYLNDEGFEDMKVQTRGSFGGLGIEVTMENGLVKVVSPIDDTPAYKAGVKAGDFITHLDGKPVIGMSLNDAVDKMRGKVGTSIQITVRREGVSEPLKFTITRDVIRIKSVRFSTYDAIGYIRITTFNAQTEPGLRAAIDAIKKEKGKDLMGYVIDLRNNPGGLLDQAIGVADDLLVKGEIGSPRGRNEEDTKRDNATPGDLADGLPVVVLINGGSASASEIVAGALQDHRRAVLLGTKSFGKGSVQTIISLPNNTAMRLTTARYYTPSGRSIQAKGIEPDILVPQSKVENIDSPEGISEADLRGALDGQAGKKHSEDPANANADKGDATPSADAPADSKDGKDGKDGKDAKKTPSIDHPELADDYQLARAMDVLRGIALYDSQRTPAGAPDLVSKDDKKADTTASTDKAEPAKQP